MEIRLAGRGGRRLPSRRHRRRVVLATVTALVAGGLAASAVARAGEVTRAYGDTATVPVLVRQVPAGAVLGADDVERRSLPLVMVPEGPADEVVGRVARDALHPGEVVLEARLGGSGSSPAAMLRPGQRAVVVPVVEATLGVAPGDHVDVLAPDDALASHSPTARRVARSAEVIGADDATVTLAVLVAEVPGVARAVLDGAVALALEGPAP